MPSQKLYIGSDHDVEYLGAKGRLSGEFINDAECSFEMKDADGNVITSGPMPYDPGSDGDYRAVIGFLFTDDLEDGATVFVEVRFTSAGNNDFRRDEFSACYRRGDE